MINDLLWRTDPDVNLETPKGLATEKFSGVTLERNGAALRLGFWTGLTMGDTDLSTSDAAALLQALTDQMNAAARDYLAAARVADDARPSIGYTLKMTAKARDPWGPNGTKAATSAAYLEARTALWAQMQVGDDELLPAATVRLRSGQGIPTRILLTHERADLWSYRGDISNELFFCPATLEVLREKLKDTAWMP